MQLIDPAKWATGSTADTELQSFIWPVSQVVSAVMRAGLVVKRFAEGSISSMYKGLKPDPTWLPAYYAIIASKPVEAQEQ
jgi:hypothetical protein